MRLKEKDKEIIKSLRRIFHIAEDASKGKIYLKKSELPISEDVLNKTRDALKDSYETSALLIVNKEKLYDLSICCDQLVKAGDIIHTCYGKLRVILQNSNIYISN